MLEPVGFLCVLLLLFLIPAVPFVRHVRRQHAQFRDEGKWRLAVENVNTTDGPATQVKIVQTSGGRRTVQIVVRTILDSAPDWDEQMTTAQAEAELRIAILNT